MEDWDQTENYSFEASSGEWGMSSLVSAQDS